MFIEEISGQVFRDANGSEFGVIRAVGDGIPKALQVSTFRAFAADGCGNFFVEKPGLIGFWDHETSQVTPLAKSEAEFLAGLVLPTPCSLDTEQVKSVWVDPTFLATFRRTGGTSNEP